MFSSGTLDVAVGVLFVFLMVATVCTAVRAGIEALLKWRARYLEYAIFQLLQDKLPNEPNKKLADKLFAHPMIDGLFAGKASEHRDQPLSIWQRGRNMPSYIPAKTFVFAMLDVASELSKPENVPAGEWGAIRFESLRGTVDTLSAYPKLQQTLRSAINASQGNLESVRANLEAWYDGAMDRVSGWYKRSTQLIIFGIACGVVGTLNVNTITIAETLYRDQSLRAAAVAAAERTTSAPTYQQTRADLQQLNLPIGWKEKPTDTSDRSWSIVAKRWGGLLITIFAAMLGAPFWFDILNKVMVIRSTVKPHEKSKEEGSEDRR